MPEHTSTLQEPALLSTQRDNQSLKCVLSDFAPLENPELWDGELNCLTYYGRHTLMDELSQAVATQRKDTLGPTGLPRDTIEYLKRAIYLRLTKLDDKCTGTHAPAPQCAFERALGDRRAPLIRSYVTGASPSSPEVSKRKDRSEVIFNVLSVDHKNRCHQK